MTELTTDEIKELRIGFKEYIDLRLGSIAKDMEALDQRVDQRFIAMERGVAVADRVLEARLTLLNEFRESMRDQTSSFMTLKEYDSWKDRIEKDILDLRDFKTAMNAKADQKTVVIAFIFSIISAVLGLIGLIEAITK